MDANMFKQIETFLPNSQTRALLQEAFGLVPASTQLAGSVDSPQTLDPSDHTFNFTDTTSFSAQQTTPWDVPRAFTGDMETSISPSTAHPDVSLGSFAPAAASSASPKPVYGPPARTSQTRGCPQRKRSKLSLDLTPFDSAEYWAQFDDEGHLGDVLENPRLGDAAETRAASESIDPTALKMGDFLDDSALDRDEALASMKLAEQLSNIDSEPPPDVPPREGLYSTPLSWEKPQLGIRTDPLAGLNGSMLSEAEQRRLIAIAMNPGPTMGGLGSGITPNFMSPGAMLGSTLDMDLSSMVHMGQPPPYLGPNPQGPNPQAAPPNPSQKKGSLAETSKAKGKEKEPDKDKAKPSCHRTAHNHIERKYRTNLKDKIAELQDAVPALAENAGDEQGAQSRTPKVSKGTILTRATEYIQFLEKKNKQIVQEHRVLSRRLHAFEQLLAATTRPSFQMPTYSRALFDPRGFC